MLDKETSIESAAETIAETLPAKKEKGTLRQQIMQILFEKPTSVGQLAKKLDSTEKSIEGHLPHVAKTIAKISGKSFKMSPSECHDCGFVFAKRDRVQRPTKCPTCRSEYISEPLFFIEQKNREK